MRAGDEAFGPISSASFGALGRLALFRGGIWQLAMFAGSTLGCATEPIELVPRAARAEANTLPATTEPATTDPAATDPSSMIPIGSEGPAPAAGCDKVDFLFVVDNSRSMREEQENLVGSFRGFIDVVLRGKVRARDYHVMVTDTDASGGLGGLAEAIGQDYTCQPAPACCESGCGGFRIPLIDVPLVESCNGVPCAEVLAPSAALECEGVLGAGKRHTPDGEPCGIEGESRYMVTGQPDLVDTFSCAGQVGTFGDGDEQPMSAMMHAVSLPMNGTGGCNEGFLRDDAVLVVTFITDGEDEDSPNEPEVWRQALLDAKGRKEKSIVVLGLMGNEECGGAAPRLETFVQSFEFGSIGSVCAPDYAPFFEAAVSVIDTACEVFEPIIR
jgi:hypothetical protein